MEQNKIIIYQTKDGQTQIDVRMENETVWLSANQMAILFGRDEKTIRKHINNVFTENEVPISKIISRYYKSLLNAAKAISFVDRAYIYGNSVDNQFSRLLLRALVGTSFFGLLCLFP